jgi:hypothetical protein
VEPAAHASSPHRSFWTRAVFVMIASHATYHLPWENSLLQRCRPLDHAATLRSRQHRFMGPKSNKTLLMGPKPGADWWAKPLSTIAPAGRIRKGQTLMDDRAP